MIFPNVFPSSSGQPGSIAQIFSNGHLSANYVVYPVHRVHKNPDCFKQTPSQTIDETKKLDNKKRVIHYNEMIIKVL